MISFHAGWAGAGLEAAAFLVLGAAVFATFAFGVAAAFLVLVAFEGASLTMGADAEAGAGEAEVADDILRSWFYGGAEKRVVVRAKEASWVNKTNTAFK
jgi:hypothetical protein